MQEFQPELYDPNSKLWKRGEKTSLYKTPIFQLVGVPTTSPDNTVSGDFYHLESKDWVNIIALTKEGNLVLIDQYRHGLGKYSLEIPGGIAEKQTLQESAEAELREETGFVSEDWEYLGKVSGNPAILNNWCHTFIARSVFSHKDGQELDESEQIDVYYYPLKNIPELLQKNIIHNGMIVAALGLFFLKYGLNYKKQNI